MVFWQCQILCEKMVVEFEEKVHERGDIMFENLSNVLALKLNI
jgi:hypothetical protein